MDDVMTVIDIAQKVREFLSGNQLLRLSCRSLGVSLVMLVVVRIPVLSGMLGDMSEKIIAIITLALMLSVSLVVGISIVDVIAWAIEKYLLRYKRTREEAEVREEEARVIAEAEAERERQAQQEREHIARQIREMSDAEREIFSKVLSGKGSGVWLAQDDAAMQTLMYKGLLERIGQVETWQDWETGHEGRAWCLLAVIPERVKAAMGGQARQVATV